MKCFLSFSVRRWIVPFFMTVVCIGLVILHAGCGSEGRGELSSRRILGERFPEQMAEVLGAGSGFGRTEEGFAPRPHVENHGFHAAAPSLKAVLPLRGEQGLRFYDLQGFEVAVREQGTEGEGELVGNAVAYSRVGGKVYWTCKGADSCEEWLMLEGGAVKQGKPVASWEIDGAVFRQAGEHVEVVDSKGRARIRVRAPKAYGEKGEPIEVRLVAQASRLELYVSADREAVLVDPLWESVGAMNVARWSHTATLLSDGRVLVAGGLNQLNGTLASAELYDSTAQTWSSAGSMITARQCHTATLLPDGRILVVGGADVGVPGQYQNNIPLGSAELYDPVTGSWTAAAPMLGGPRYLHAAMLLPNGRVLIAGGYTLAGNQGALQTSEEYDPNTGTWSLVGTMNTPRGEFTATLLRDGRVMAAGGNWPTQSVNPLVFVEMYEPATKQWIPAAPMSIPRFSHRAVLLPGGQVLVAGGSFGFSFAESELYTPETNTWLPISTMNNAHADYGIALLPNGSVLAVGGFGLGSIPLANAELYDWQTKSWHSAGAMSTDRALHTATLLPGGQVLIVGGYSYASMGAVASAEIYDSATSGWRPTGAMGDARYFHTATLLRDQRVLVTGGGFAYGTKTSKAFLYDSMTETWSPTSPMAEARARHSATLLSNGRVLVAGGYGENANDLASAELYDPVTGTWLSTGAMVEGRSLQTASLLPDGRVLVAGGIGPSGAALASAELYDPATGNWAPTGSMSTARTDHAAVVLANGQVLVTGGSGVSGGIVSAELYDPVTGAWLPVGDMIGPRNYHTATLLPNGQVLVAGGNLLNAELYDPASGLWQPTGNMLGIRGYHWATLLPNGQVLVVGGTFAVPTVPTGTAELYDPKTGVWTSADPMTTPRIGFAAALLPNGRVLAVGGSTPQLVASAELYVPANLWDRGPSMHTGRVHHTASLLPDQSVLIAGGKGEFGYRSSSERYDPSTNTWVSTCPAINPPPGCSMSQGRAYHTATTYDNGSIVVIGGVGQSGQLNTAEFYDPPSGLWFPDGQILTARLHHTAVNLPGTGYILIAGGWGNNGFYTGPLSSTEAFIPAAGVSIQAPPMSKARWKHTATLIPNVGVIVIGGWRDSGPFANSPGQGEPLNDAELFSLVSGAWLPLPTTMTYQREGHAATLIKAGPQAGKILITGGTSEAGPLAAVELFDPSSFGFSGVASMLQARSDHFAVPLADGRVLVAGGTGPSGPVSGAEVYDPAANTWMPIRSLRAPRSYATGSLLSDGRVLAVGGEGIGEVSLATTELFAFSQDGALCEQAADCQSGFCADTVCCASACAAGPCDVCSVRTDIAPLGGETAGMCVYLTGPVCNDGNACTKSDACQLGVCVGTNPVSCVAPDQCQNPGVCDPTTGQCSSATSKNDGAYCDDNNPCTSNECQAGQCAITSQKICPPPDQCHEVVSCDLLTGDCPLWPAKADGSLCNDGNSCTKVDTCQAGVCMGSNETQCPQPDACHNAVQCDTLTGECPPLPAKPEGTFCNDSDACTQTDICLSGVCTGTNAVQCPAPDQCHEAVACEPASGLCPALPPKPEGSFCDDGNACTKTDICLSGACAGTEPVECPQPDACHEAVACDPLTGGCPELPMKPAGTYCPDDNDCTLNEVCNASGVCEVKETTCDCAECVPYRCFGRARSCLTQCQSINECAPGFVCDRLGACIPPPPSSGTLETGCAMKGPSSSGEKLWPMFWLSLLGLGFGRARRRSPGSCST